MFRSSTGETPAGHAPLIRKIGGIGFAFFFLKGMAWLALPLLLGLLR